MIYVRLLSSGWAIINSKTTKSHKKLTSLPYIKVQNGVGITYWPHLIDLKQDFKKIVWADNLQKVYKNLIYSTNKSDVSINIPSLFNKNKKPYNYQLKGIKRITAGPVILADDTGLGKTPQTIGSAASLYKERIIKRAVFITPAGLKTQWYKEFFEFIDESKFNNLRNKVRIAQGSKSNRKKIYASNWNFLIINYALINRDHNILKKFVEKGEIGFVGLDEASYIRNPNSKRTKYIKKLFYDVPYKVAITATPIENSLVDLFSIMEFIDNGIFMSRNYFEDKYCMINNRTINVTTKSGYEFRKNIKKIIGYKNLSEVKFKIKNHYIRRLPSDVGLELPDVIVNWIPVEMNNKQKKIYKKIRNKTKKKINKEKNISLFYILHDLRKVCNSTELIDENIKISPKIDRLKELMDTELSGQQLIVFTDYKEKLSEIFKREFKKYKPTFFTGVTSEEERRQREIDLELFKNGKSKMLICTSAGERGLNLQFAPIVVNFDLPWNPARMKQRIGRICRIGSKFEKVRLINLLTLNTIEEKLILEKIYSKRQLFEKIIGQDDYLDQDPLTEMEPSDLVKFI